MVTPAWAFAAAGFMLLPGADPLVRRLDALTESGRLHAATSAAVPARSLQLGGIRGRVVVVVVAAAGCALAVVVGPVLAAAATVVAGTVGQLVRAAARRRAAEQSAAALLAGLSLVAAELEAGSRPGAAFTAAAEADPTRAAQYLAAAEACADGRDPPAATDELRPLRMACVLANRSGAPLATVVRRVADDQATMVAQRDAVGAALAGARSSAVLLAGLPVLGLLLGAAMQAQPLAILFGTAAGRLVCLVGVVLDAAGLLWTQRLAMSAMRI